MMIFGFHTGPGGNLLRDGEQLLLNPSYDLVWSVVSTLRALSRITGLTKGLNVGYIVASFKVKWNNVIRRQLYITPSTTKTPVSVVGAKIFEFLGRVITLTSSLFCPAAADCCIEHSPIVFLPSFAAILNWRWISRVSFPLLLVSPLFVFCPACVCSLSNTLSVFCLPLAGHSPVAGRVFEVSTMGAFFRTRHTRPTRVPFTSSTLHTRQPVSFGHNKKSPLPECLTRGLYGTILSGRLPRPHSPELLIAVAGVFSFAYSCNYSTRAGNVTPRWGNINV